MRSTNREKDELNLRNRCIEVAGRQNIKLMHVKAEKRPMELVQLIDEETSFFSHYDGTVIDEKIGDTMSFDYTNDINVSIRHYYPFAPEAKVKMDEKGDESSQNRLVPVSLMSRDLELDSVIIGRFVAGITKENTLRQANSNFSLQLLVMSVCGNGTFRENITFRGVVSASGGMETSISSQDLNLVAAIFHILEEAYGMTGLEFLALEVIRNRQYLSGLTGYDIDIATAFDAYVKLFGSYMGEFLKGYRDQVVEISKKTDDDS